MRKLSLLQEGKPAGTVFVGLAGPGTATHRRLALPGDRGQVRAGTVAEALDLLRVVLLSANAAPRGSERDRPSRP